MTTLHERENNPDSQQHLDTNRQKFETDAQFLLRQMINGEVLTAKTVVQKYGVADRRLRDLEIDGKCEKRWRLNENGKRMYVEYFVPRIKSPSKSEVIQRATKVIELLKSTGQQLSLL